MTELISTSAVCKELGLSEPALRHALRRPGAPRPTLHPSARVFLWTAEDVDRLRKFLSEKFHALEPDSDGRGLDQEEKTERSR